MGNHLRVDWLRRVVFEPQNQFGVIVLERRGDVAGNAHGLTRDHTQSQAGT